MTDTKIKIGDFVKVDFNAARFTLGFNLEVISMPQASGDSWIFKDNLTNEVHYISEGCTITKMVGKS